MKNYLIDTPLSEYEHPLLPGWSQATFDIPPNSIVTYFGEYPYPQNTKLADPSAYKHMLHIVIEETPCTKRQSLLNTHLFGYIIHEILGENFTQKGPLTQYDHHYLNMCQLEHKNKHSFIHLSFFIHAETNENWWFSMQTNINWWYST